MSRTDLTDDILAERLVRAFEADSADVRASTEPFDPIRSSSDVLAEGRRRSLRPLVAAAAAVVVAAAAVTAVVVQRASDDHITPPAEPSPDVEPSPEAETDASEPVDIPDGVLVPGSVPEDLTLWAAEWMRAPTGVMFTEQLFQRADGSGFVIQVQPHLFGSDGGTTGGDPLTVRGLQATTMPAKEFPDTDTTLFWNEGASISATYSGMSQAETVAALDTLSWRSDERTEGFAPPTAGDLVLQAETLASAGGMGESVLAGRFRYSDSPTSFVPGSGRQVEVRTTAGPTALGGMSLQDVLHGEQRPGGGVESFDPDFGTLTVQWPDGRAAWIDANGTPVTRDELRAIADGIVPVDGTQLAATIAEVSTAIVDVSTVVAEAELPAGRVTVRDVGGGEVMCVVPSGGDVQCPHLFTVDGPMPMASLLVNGEWWLVAAGAGPLSVRVGTDPLSLEPPGSGAAIPVETAPLSDGRTAVLARPEPGVDAVAIEGSDGGGFTLQRPSTTPSL